MKKKSAVGPAQLENFILQRFLRTQMREHWRGAHPAGDDFQTQHDPYYLSPQHGRAPQSCEKRPSSRTVRSAVPDKWPALSQT
jgi:hypothetical protein